MRVAEDIEPRIAWILGSPRTGSSWLLRLLIFPWNLASKEPSGLNRRRRHGGRLPAVVPINEPYLPAHLTPLEAPPFEPGRVYAPSEFLMNRFRVGDPSYFFSDAYADAWRPAVRQMALERFRAQAERAAAEHGLDDPLVLIKEPNGSHGAELLMSLFPRAKLVFLLRDGRDVVDSLLDGFRHGGWLRRQRPDITVDEATERLDWIRLQSWLWVHRTEAVQRAYAAHPEELRATVRYEELRREAAAVLAPLAEWLGLERTPAEIAEAVETLAFERIPAERRGPGTARRAASPGLWRENMSAEEQDAMHEIMAVKLGELGYEPA